MMNQNSDFVTSSLILCFGSSQSSCEAFQKFRFACSVCSLLSIALLSASLSNKSSSPILCSREKITVIQCIAPFPGISSVEQVESKQDDSEQKKSEDEPVIRSLICARSPPQTQINLRSISLAIIFNHRVDS